MAIIDSIVAFIEGLEEKDFYKYTAITGLIVAGTICILIFRHYYTIGSLTKHINVINDLRENAKSVLDKFVIVEQQRSDVDAMITQEPNFKIGGYMKELLAKQNLANKKKMEQYLPVDRQDKYRETILTTQFVDMTMQELTTLLNEIEQKERVYTKSLEITQSKIPGTIEVTLTIATLQPKEQSAG
ncbi:hypothetical protein KC460_04770 [Candidatus Dependentiae bacterium]|nr:hypothetical protein [Candidatus Dependentiae bacterium]